MRQDDEEAYERDEAISALADMRDARDEARREREEAIARAEKAEAGRDQASDRAKRAEDALARSRVDYEMADAENAALRAEIQRLINIAGEALGTDPSLRTVACVEALALWCEQLREGNLQTFGAGWRAAEQIVRTGKAEAERASKDRELLAAANADCADLRQLLREVRAANWYSTPIFDLAARIKRALGEE